MQVQRAINETTAYHLLKGIAANIRWFTREPSINSVVDMMYEALENNDHETIAFACRDMYSWYHNNLSSIKQYAQGHIYEACCTNMERLPSLIEDIMLHPEWTFGRSAAVEPRRRGGKGDSRLLISHSSKDIDCVRLLVNLLRTIGLTEKHVVCTSYPGYNIPYGADIYDYLRNCFLDNNLYVLLLISKDNYYGSVPCLNEMGAAWVTGAECVPMLLPGMRPSEMTGAIGADRLAISLDQQNAGFALTSLKDQLVGFFGLTPPDENVWEQARDSFLSELRKVRPIGG